MFHPPRTLVLDGRLGRGGFGEVYRGRLLRDRLTLDVAVKVLHPSLDPRGQGPERLRDEARFLGRLRHRNVPHVHDLAWLDGHLAFLVEYIDGIDLSEANARGDLPRRAALEALADVADALDAAWNHTDTHGTPLRLVHRDLKPSNIRLGRDGAARLLDFGIARSDAFDRSAATALDAIVGTPAWMAPERFDRDDGGPASDSWALAAVVWETLVGQRLWHGRDARALLGLAGWQDRYDEAVASRLEALPADVPPLLRQTLAVGLRWDPSERPSAAVWSTCLRDLAASTPGLGLIGWCRGLPVGGRGDPAGRAGHVYEEGAPGVWLPSASTATTVVLSAPQDAPPASRSAVLDPSANPERPVAPPATPRRRSMALWFALAALGLTSGAAGAWYVRRLPQPENAGSAFSPTDGTTPPEPGERARATVEAAPLATDEAAPSAMRQLGSPAPDADAGRAMTSERPIAPSIAKAALDRPPRAPAEQAKPAPSSRRSTTAQEVPVAPAEPPSAPTARVEVRFSPAALAAGATLYDTRGGKYQSAGAVPAGTYKLVASLDGDASRTYVDGVDLSADTRWEVHCDTALRNCALRPARTP